MLELKDIHLKYGQKVILDNINLIFKNYEFTTILGRNGSGKSTILKLISKQIKANSGTVIIFDKNIESVTNKQISSKLSYMMQFNSNINNLTVLDMITIATISKSSLFKNLTKSDKEIINKIIKLTQLNGYENSYINNLSGGEKQRVYLAMCLCQQPEVLILDEPTNHLDLHYQIELLNIIKNYSLENKVTVICVLHDLNQAIKYSDNLVFIKDKKIFKTGHPKDIISEKLIQDIFKINVKIHHQTNNIYIQYIY